MLKPKRIIHSGAATIVFWNDNTKTIVKCSENDEPDNYTAFCTAYCKKVFGNNSHLKRVIKDAENAKPEKKSKKKDSSSKFAVSTVIHKSENYLRQRICEEIVKSTQDSPVCNSITSYYGAYVPLSDMSVLGSS